MLGSSRTELCSYNLHTTLMQSFAQNHAHCTFNTNLLHSTLQRRNLSSTCCFASHISVQHSHNNDHQAIWNQSKKSSDSLITYPMYQPACRILNTVGLISSTCIRLASMECLARHQHNTQRSSLHANETEPGSKVLDPDRSTYRQSARWVHTVESDMIATATILKTCDRVTFFFVF